MYFWGGGGQKDKFLNQLEKDNLGCPDIQNALNSVSVTVFVDFGVIEFSFCFVHVNIIFYLKNHDC